MFKKDTDNKYTIDNVLNNFETFDGSSIKFNKGFLMNNDKNFVSINENDQNRINLYDIETEKLISSFENNVNIKDIVSEYKTGPITESNTIYSITNNG